MRRLVLLFSLLVIQKIDAQRVAEDEVSSRRKMLGRGDCRLTSLRSVIQSYLCDKCPRISILLSHLCESSPVERLMPEPQKSRSHCFMNLTSLMSLASCLSELFIFQSSHPETAYLLVLLPMKGNKLSAGNENNESTIQVDRPGGVGI